MENNIEYDINIYGNLMIIDNEKQNIRVIEVPGIKKLFNEKQQLISFLEDKIKECDMIMQMSIDSLNDKFADKKDEENVRRTLKITIREYEIEIKAYQEVLDFVNKGGKE